MIDDDRNIMIMRYFGVTNQISQHCDIDHISLWLWSTRCFFGWFSNHTGKQDHRVSNKLEGFI